MGHNKTRGAGPLCICGLDLDQGDGAHEEDCDRLYWLRHERAKLLLELRGCAPDRASMVLETYEKVTDELAAGDPTREPRSRRAARQHLRRTFLPS